MLLGLNAGGKLSEPLDLIYPKEGIVTADYPLMLLDSAHRADYDKLVAYLRRPDVQTRIMTQTHRRPSIPEVQPDSQFPSQVLVEVQFPASLDVVNQLIEVLSEPGSAAIPHLLRARHQRVDGRVDVSTGSRRRSPT